MQIEGKIDKIIYYNQETGYTVAVFNTEDGSIRIAGSVVMPRVGTSYALEGDFFIHHKYGEQFNFASYAEIRPKGRNAIITFLSSGRIRGVGPALARLIVDAFDEDTFRIIEDEPERLLEIRGIGKKSLEKITQSYAESLDFANMVFKLSELGIVMNDAIRIYRMYGSAAENVIKNNPYSLVDDIRGIDFHKADEIAMKLGFALDSELRIEGGIRFVLSQWMMSGSTLMHRDELLERVAEVLDLTRERVGEILQDLIFNGDLQEEIINDVPSVYLQGHYRAELNIAHKISELKSAITRAIPARIDNLIDDAEANLSRSNASILSSMQRNAIAACLENNVSIITGGPGTGKTTIINVLVRIFNMLGYKTALAAPTGRAAKRMEEASGEAAMTIHRLLEYVFSDDNRKVRFGRNEDNMLEYDAIIVDEASMIDTMLMDGFLRAVKRGTRLIFTGDADQLPSVGAGNVLRDMIASECVPTTRLTEIFRQGEDSKIVINSHRINQGEYPEQGQAGDDFFILHKDSEEKIRASIREMVEGRIARSFECVKSADDIQILTPTKKGILGSISLNSLLQEIINPPQPSIAEIKVGSRIFREGDRVMQLKNNYNAEWIDETDWSEGQGIFNGDMGIVTNIDLEIKMMNVRYDNKVVTYAGEMFEEIDLAYAITVHKSQGSEFPAVIIPMSNFSPMLMARNLLYTAVTRGKQLVLIIGSPRCLNRMIDNNYSDTRQTGLRHLLVTMEDDPFESLS